MGRTLTDSTALSYSVESALGVAGTTWFTIKPNDVTDIGAKLAKVARNPISKNRSRLKGQVVGLTSGFGVVMDLTMGHLIDFVQGFMFSIFKGARVTAPTAATTTAYTVPAMVDALPSGTLVYARGFANAVNNGLKVVTTGGTTTSIPITGGGMTAESTTTAQHVTVELCGVQGVSGDIQIDANTDIISTTLDFTTMKDPPQVGQWIFIGGTVAATNFASLLTNTQRWARVLAVAAHKITLDKNSFAADTGTGKTIHLYWGRFVRQVAVDSADYLTQSYTFEGAFENLGAVADSDEFLYPAGNYADSLKIEYQEGQLAKMTLGFVGVDTPSPTTSRATGASTPIKQVQEVAFSPKVFGRLRIAEVDDTGITTDFKMVSIMLNNNVKPENKLGQLPAAYMNTGNMEIDIESTCIFSTSRTMSALRDNSTLGFDMAVRNDDGGFVFDVPEMTVAGGDLDLPRNESVNIKLKMPAHESSTFGYQCSFSVFGFVPAT